MCLQLLSFSVEQWAKKFGDELWELGQKMTKSPEIQAVLADFIVFFKYNSQYNLLFFFFRNTKPTMHGLRRRTVQVSLTQLWKM